jgi:hypothetical protein
LVVFARVQLTEIAWEPGLAVQMAPCETHLALWQRSESCHTPSPILQPIRIQMAKDITKVRTCVYNISNKVDKLNTNSGYRTKLYLAFAEPSAVGDCDLQPHGVS